MVFGQKKSSTPDGPQYGTTASRRHAASSLVIGRIGLPWLRMVHSQIAPPIKQKNVPTVSRPDMIPFHMDALYLHAETQLRSAKT
jgi:hypothetical protein